MSRPVPAFDRRALLAAAPAFAMSAGSVLAATTPGQGASPRDTLQSAQANFEAYVRVRGSLVDEPVYERVNGWTYGTVPGEPARLLWRLDGFSVSRYRRTSATQFLGHSRYLGALREPQGPAILRQLDNPYTGARKDVPLSKYGPSTMYLTPGGVRGTADAPAGPPLQPTRLGEWIHFTDHVLSAGPAAVQPDFDIVSYGARIAEAFDPRRHSVGFSSGFTGVERWRDWMQMGDRAGGLVWHVNSAKVGRADVPADLLALAHDAWGERIEEF